MNISIFEEGMLICFGFTWPVNIYKSNKSKTTKANSFFFLVIILLGYIFGITHKLIYSRDIVLILYIINLIMVSIDIIIFFINKNNDIKNDEIKKQKGA